MNAKVVKHSLLAMSWDVPVNLVSTSGQRLGPVHVTERLMGQELRDGTSVAIRVESGEVLHLADIASIERAR